MTGCTSPLFLLSATLFIMLTPSREDRGFMEKCTSVIHRGKTIIFVDISNTFPEQAISILTEAQKKISALPPKSALILTDASNAVYNTESSNAMKEFSKNNTPFVKASAVVGAEGLRAVLLQAIAALTRREIKSCKTRIEAMDWLIDQA
jgi:hypothetical protein